jgi:hypothetical protein
MIKPYIETQEKGKPGKMKDADIILEGQQV